MARNVIAKKTVDAEKGVVTFAFSNDNSVSVVLSELPTDIQTRLALHGLSQKLGDSYAGAGGDVKEAMADLTDVLKSLQSGKWTERTPGEPRVSALLAALVRVSGRSEEEAKAVIDSMDDDQRKALRAHPQIKAAMAEIAAEKAKAKAAESDGGFDLAAFTKTA